MKNAPSAVEPISVDIATAAKLTSLGRSKLYQMLSDGTLESKTIGRRRVIPYAALKALVA